MIRVYIIVVFSLFSVISSFSQNDITFKPSGRVIARSFFDYSTDFSKESGFDITRAFLGYRYQITPSLSGQIVLDGASGSNSDDRLEVYVRNAFLNWKDEKLNIHAGMTNLFQFTLQQNYWKHRYVLKSFQDLNNMAPSVDLGITAKYDLSDSFSADVSFTNGTGNKNVKKSGSKRYGAGLTLHPIRNIVLRVYSDIYNQSSELRGDLPEGVSNINFKNQYTLSLFAGYQNNVVSSGVEYNKVYNKDFIYDKDYFGYSIYFTVRMSHKVSLFARYDITDSNTPSLFVNPWNDGDGQLMIGGMEYKPFRQIKIAPNFRNINSERGESKQYFFVNVEFNL